jgi:hypothetical protein
MFSYTFRASTREEEYERQITNLLDELKAVKQKEERDFEDTYTFGNEAKPR